MLFRSTPDTGVNVVTAPGGYYTNGASVCSADGTAHLFHGVDRPSLEWNSSGQWNNSEGIPRSDFAAIATWHANVVRISLNQDFWLAGAALHVTVSVRSTIVPSEYVPMAWRLAVPPGDSVAPVGETAMLWRLAALTVTVLSAVSIPLVAVTTDVPTDLLKA